jgi:hypothetical protein
MDNKKQQDLIEMLVKENRELRKASLDLAIHALYVIRNSDGLHRLAKSCSRIIRIISDENGRGK